MGPKAVLPLLLVLALALIIGCGTSATPEAAATAAPAATVAPVPQAQPKATTAPSVVETKPQGTLNIGYAENLGVFNSHPRLTGGNYALFVGTSLGESLVGVAGPEQNFAFRPKLIKEWGLAADNLTWTFKLQEGVQFHKGYGEMTADDVIWTYEQCAAEGSRCNRASSVRRLWFNDKGYTKKIDDYTIEVNTGEPQYDMLLWAGVPYSAYIMSKKQVEDVGEDEANLNGAGTGPWEFVEARTGQYWEFKAVEDHWRKPPYFAEMRFHDIPEESTRLANFQTGNLDTMVMQLDSKPAVEQVAGVKFMRVEGGGTEHLAWMGNFYVGLGTPEQRLGYDPDLPWVSSNPDINSEEWKQAVKVRRAMSIAIDRQEIVDTIVKGEGKPGILWGWEGNEHRLPPDIQKGWEFNPEKAKQLLAEAGYPDGFEVTLTPSIRGVPGEVDACFAVATMWEEIGIRTKQKKVLYPTFRLLLKDKEFNQVNCHGTGGRSDPMSLVTGSHSRQAFGIGFTHPILDDLIDNAIATVDSEERVTVSNEIARFLFDNAVETSLYQANILWPLGVRIDSWKEHLDYGDRRILSSTEYTPHRK